MNNDNILKQLEQFCNKNCKDLYTILWENQWNKKQLNEYAEN